MSVKESAATETGRSRRRLSKRQIIFLLLSFFLSTLQSSIFVLSAFLVIYKRLSEQYESTATEKISKESQG